MYNESHRSLALKQAHKIKARPLLGEGVLLHTHEASSLLDHKRHSVKLTTIADVWKASQWERKFAQLLPSAKV